jgi:hypothetical protein
MAFSTTKTKAISLGKQLVEQLGCDPHGDTLSRWMAHYIAEQMAAAQNARGKTRSAAAKRCFQTILLLWEHRAELPTGRRPFESFEPILRALAAIDPNAKDPFYHGLSPGQCPEGKIKPGTVEFWADFITRIDAAARVLVQMALDEACERATNEQTRNYLKKAIPNSRKGDLESVRIMLDRYDASTDPRTGLIQSRLKQLEAFNKTCSAAEKALRQKLHHRVKN